MNKKLELLSMANDYNIIKESDYYSIELKNSNLIAYIDLRNNEVSYGVTGVYDSGCDVEEFDIKELKELEKFCNLMVDKNE